MRDFDLMLLSSYATVMFMIVIDVLSNWLQARRK